jgi:hypothetical protein
MPLSVDSSNHSVVYADPSVYVGMARDVTSDLSSPPMKHGAARGGALCGLSYGFIAGTSIGLQAAIAHVK